MPDSLQANLPIAPAVSTRLITLTQTIRNLRSGILTEKNLVPGQDDFLFALLTSDGITMGSLAEALAISASSATKAAIKLEAAGLIHREASRVDSRQNYAHLTALGRETAREILTLYEKLDETFFSRLKNKDRDRLLKILDNLENPSKGAGKKPKKAGSKKKKNTEAK